MDKNKKKITRKAFSTAIHQIIKPRLPLLFVGFLLIALNSGFRFALPVTLQTFVDDVLVEQNWELLWQIIAVLAIAALFQAITSFLLTKLVSIEAQKLVMELRISIQKHIIRLPTQFFDKEKSGSLVSRIMSDVEGVRNLVGTGLIQLISGSLTGLIAFIYLLSKNAPMTLMSLGFLIVFALISIKAFTYIRPIFRKRREINAQVTGRLTETLGGIRVVKGFNAEEREMAAFRDGVEGLFLNVKKTLTTQALVVSAGTLLIGFATMAAYAYGGANVIQGKMSTGELFSFVAVLGIMVVPVVQMSSIGTQITEAFAGLDRMEEILEVSPENEHAKRQTRLPVLKGKIEIDKVHFAYEESEEVLRDISLSADPGTVTALVGSSGSGKSTLAGLVAGFLTPTQGIVRVDGKDLSQVNLDTFRSQLGVVLQDEFLFDGTIRENILFPKPGASQEQLMEAAKDAFVSEFTDRFEDGLETVIGERGVKLSGGQRQRVAIARALLADPRLLILDEATSNLDTESEMLIQKSLRHLMQGRTTFVIAHRLSTIRQADQILVIEKGAIVERGDHEELIEKKGRYHELYTYQARI